MKQQAEPTGPIVLDARWVFPRLSGIGRYTLELLRCFGRKAGGFRFRVWTLSDERAEFIRREAGLEGRPEFEFETFPKSPFSPTGQFEAARRLRAAGAALYHSTNFMVPLPAFPGRAPHRVPCVCNIHDLIPLLHPEYTPRALKTRFFPVYRALMRGIARRADAVVTGSESAKCDILANLPVPPERVTAIWDGVDARYRPAEGASAPRDPAAPKTILCVGRADPYKNQTGLIRAFALLLQSGINAELQIAGAPDERYPEPHRLVHELELESRVRWTGYLDDDALLNAYRSADVLAHLSLYEGFGLPVAEAMACGMPVVCSDAASLPEVAGDAALLVPAGDSAAAADALRRVLTDPALAAQLREKGLRQAGRFSWDAAAAAVLGVYRQLLAKNRETAP
jgi:glycosyltransferase involved in cell wall biosynthesis